jgi:hypothetical protein
VSDWRRPYPAPKLPTRARCLTRLGRIEPLCKEAESCVMMARSCCAKRKTSGSERFGFSEGLSYTVGHPALLKQLLLQPSRRRNILD